LSFLGSGAASMNLVPLGELINLLILNILNKNKFLIKIKKVKKKKKD
jgi:hypothetical protein